MQDSWSVDMTDSVEKLIAEHEATVEKLQQEIVSLRDIKLPMGDDSPSQQARAWVYVWDGLEKMGLLSFLPSPVAVTSGERIVQFVHQLQNDLKTYGQHHPECDFKDPCSCRYDRVVTDG